MIKSAGAPLCFNITIVIMLYTKSLPVAYQVIMTNPNIAVVHIMASRIYRNVNFQAHAPANDTVIVTDIKFDGRQVASEGTTLDDVENQKQDASLEENADTFKNVGEIRRNRSGGPQDAPLFYFNQI